MTSTSRYADSFPALTGETVTEGHARYCRENGHATHTTDGVVAIFCPRCGESVPVFLTDSGEDDSEDGPAITNEEWPHYMAGRDAGLNPAEACERVAAMRRHPAGKGRPTVTGNAYVDGMPPVPGTWTDAAGRVYRDGVCDWDGMAAAVTHVSLGLSGNALVCSAHVSRV